MNINPEDLKTASVCSSLLLSYVRLKAMPKVKRSRKPPPEGWELIEPTIDELDAKMREGIVIVSMFCICSVKSADFYSDFSQVFGSIVLLTKFCSFVQFS